MIIVGDIGGTKTLLALADPNDCKKDFIHINSYPSQQYSSLSNIIIEFLKECSLKNCLKTLAGACFAIAGPVKKEKFKLTNLPWEIDPTKLAESCGTNQVFLINDLEANAYGIEVLPAESFLLLKNGNEKAIGNRAVISPGTGLGEAGLFWDGVNHIPFASEGGHADFAPKNETEIELLRYLRSRFEHVSYERILSGPGLQNIYEFLRDQKRMEEPTWLSEELKQKDQPAVISENALNGKSIICNEALNLFVSIFGAEAGNVALKFLSIGGLFIGGGISPKILPKLKEHSFLDAFYDKGRMRAVLEEISIHIILDNKTSIKGAAHFCRKKIGSVVGF